MTTPAVSVVMGAYNCPRYIPYAIDSILHQTFRDFEFLLINDGSTDSTPEILQQFARRDNRIRIVHAPHGGIVAARNLGLAAARAPLICSMDQDDIALPDRLARQFAFLQQNPDVHVVGGWHETMDNKGRPIRIVHSPLHHAEIDANHIRGHTSIAHSCTLYRTAAARAAGGYEPRSELAEDLDLWLRIAERGHLANLPHVVLRYREHAASASSRRHDRQLAAMKDSCLRAAARRGIPPHPLETEQWRPPNTRRGRLEYDLLQGWRAFNNGHPHTARVFAAKALTHAPLSLRPWKLLACATLKRPAPADTPTPPLHTPIPL